MKRGKALKRATPLLRVGRLARRAFSSQRATTSPEERHARKTLRTRSCGHCEICRSPALDVHHRKNRSQGGGWELSNLMHLCRFCHIGVTENPARAMAQGWTVPSHRDPATVPVWVYGREFVFLTADGGIEPAEEEAA